MFAMNRSGGPHVALFVVFCVGSASAEEGEHAQGPETVRRHMESGDILPAYAEARKLTIGLASQVAEREIEQLVRKYPADLGGGYYRAPELGRLLAVALDAWPFLRDEWSRMEGQGPGDERRRRRSVLISCWILTREERALGLLMEFVLKHMDTYAVSAVETIVDMDLGRNADDGPKEVEKKLEEWWKRYAPQWRARMNARYGHTPSASPPEEKNTAPGASSGIRDAAARVAQTAKPPDMNRWSAVSPPSESSVSEEPRWPSALAEHTKGTRTVEPTSSDTPAFAATPQEAQAPPSSGNLSWTYFPIGLGAGLALGAAGAWLFLRRRRGG